MVKYGSALTCFCCNPAVVSGHVFHQTRDRQNTRFAKARVLLDPRFSGTRASCCFFSPFCRGTGKRKKNGEKVLTLGYTTAVRRFFADAPRPRRGPIAPVLALPHRSLGRVGFSVAAQPLAVASMSSSLECSRVALPTVAVLASVDSPILRAYHLRSGPVVLHLPP